MRTIMKLFGIFVLAIGMLWLWNDGFFVRLMPSYIKKEKLSEKYGGVYVFYPEFREEIKKRERERREYMDKYLGEEIKIGEKTQFVDFTYVDSILPQILSNGCTYHNQAFGPYREYFEPYYEKIKEFVGEEAYKKLKLSLRTTSFYECGDGKKVIITIYTDILDIYTQYGLFGDEGAGFRLTNNVLIQIGGSNTFELRNGKFEKVEKEYEGWR
ncbi:hypothetical protein [Helicobacter kayseriensis]|uniref:hypothetical protein n=1 Tax=Helicobacter kayseriensis TaxID=2905877 RepID=UPI001E4A1F78|nr:hypothetical protein [Helicobacter kayseriensis]MCE3047813.1 hypothetical protein [Helicobacter kayseriensis]MCE3049179.1 hypothetical protein [Helicobacter kayseriensis]